MATIRIRLTIDRQIEQITVDTGGGRFRFDVEQRSTDLDAMKRLRNKRSQ